MDGMVFASPWSCYNPCGIDEGRDGFEGLAAAHKPGYHNPALCEGCAGKHAICDEFAGNAVQRMFNGGYDEAQLST